MEPQCPLTLVADNSTPAIRAIAARPVLVACPSILTVITGEATVVAKGVIQADYKTSEWYIQR